MTPVDVSQGDGAVILGQPHGGTYLPTDIFNRLNEQGKMLADTDWHIHQLYDGLLSEASVVRANFHRYVIDANRDPNGASLYPGQNTTGLCPSTDFDGRAIWQDGQGPTETEINARRQTFHAPYHTALAAEVARVRQRHGYAILFDCHSIRSHIPFLFKGTLPDFSIGSNDGASCSAMIEAITHGIATFAPGYSTVLNDRFKGGWTTRHYGQPSQNVHAIQMELAQSTYLTEEATPWSYDAEKASRLRPYLANILDAISATAQEVFR